MPKKQGEEITFNEYGQCKFPKKCEDALWNVAEVILPYLDALSMMEVRAVQYNVSTWLNADFIGYVLRRQTAMRKLEELRKVKVPTT